ncbi:low molecular weight phosphotyrosine protein phosphatase [Psychrosphaera sp. B3R10]|uniref:low molecular weight protein-tyrosine-phosphatase n=1 Tax=unclassified Psychrosphaera TaxID=2641570 RepID=UPI001C09F18B|nr:MULTISPECIES: low molecular weight protein-tyrosine-phosphatase [unclassified Psychrosphaera]MBU2882236.1 low molecular weight phosphotyrosine protein phosphatase [Psychrosphaera sp. I2R16]MBU2988917.1 low molecular weight phosphotyrosine protein phosphatase [Psychrosphaera sp. B3R10]
MSDAKITSVLFVCLGNICRSPTAHAIFRQKAESIGLYIDVESAGTSAYHEGKRPDPRSVAAGKKRNYDFSDISSRKIKEQDFEHYDLILAMDNDNLASLKRRCPAEFQSKIKLMLAFSEKYNDVVEVPDPYYGGAAGFEFVLDLIEDASDGLISAISKN